MAIFIDIPEIAGDAKDKGWKPFSGKVGDPAKWFIRADSITFDWDNSAEDDSEADTPTPTSAPVGNNAPIARAGSGSSRAAGGTQRRRAPKGDKMTVTKKLDYASPSLAMVVMNKQSPDSSEYSPYSEATFYITSSQREVFLKVIIRNFVVTSYNLTVESNENSTSTSETVNFKFDYIEWTYNETNTKGEIEYTDSSFKWPENSPLKR
jgi:type VI protein secretion system component Hcp